MKRDTTQDERNFALLRELAEGTTDTLQQFIQNNTLTPADIAHLLNRKKRLGKRFADVLHAVLRGEFSNERTETTTGYIKYRHPKSISEQVTILRRIFPEYHLQADESIPSRFHLPLGAEGWLVVPLLRDMTIESQYLSASNTVIRCLDGGQNRYIFDDLSQGALNSRYMRNTVEMNYFWRKCGSTKDEFNTIVVPFQFGKKYAGYSPRHASEMLEDNEYGCDVYTTIIAILTHSDELLVSESGLDCNCLGNITSNDASEEILLSFDFGENRLWCTCVTEDCITPNAGCPTVYLLD